VSAVPVTLAANATCASGFTVTDEGERETATDAGGTVTCADVLRKGSATLVATT
jgi:hypothetical protein